MSDQDDEKALMDAAIELMRGPGETPTPKLDAATLPVGTVMVLGGRKWLYGENRGWGGNNSVAYHVAMMVFYGGENGNSNLEVTPQAVQELIDRGVEFRLPEGGA